MGSFFYIRGILQLWREGLVEKTSLIHVDEYVFKKKVVYILFYKMSPEEQNLSPFIRQIHITRLNISRQRDVSRLTI